MHQMNIADRRRDGAWAMNEIEASYHATVSVMGDDGFPYAVPMCVFKVGDQLCFHTAVAGRLNTLLLANPKVCVTAVTKAAADPENTTVRYRSGMAFGTAALAETEADKKRVAAAFFAKYLPNHPKEAAFIDRMAEICALWCVTVNEAVGKESLPGHNV